MASGEKIPRTRNPPVKQNLKLMGEEEEGKKKRREKFAVEINKKNSVQ